MHLQRVLLAVGLLFCAAARAEITIYDLPGDDPRQLVASAVIQALHGYCESQSIECVASPLPNGELLVEAPRAAHMQLEEVVAQLRIRSERAAQAELRPITLHYWAISGSPSQSDADQQALVPLAPVLRQLEQLNGDLGFEVQDKAALTVVLPDGNASITGRGGVGLSVSHRTLRADARTLRAEVEISYSKTIHGAADDSGNEPPGGNTAQTPRPPVTLSQTFQATVTLRRGEFVVLGERTFRDAEPGGRLLTMFYVVHWPENE